MSSDYLGLHRLLAVSFMQIAPFLTLFLTENLHRASNSLYRVRHNFYNKYFLLLLSIKRPSFLTLISLLRFRQVCSGD